MRVLIVDDSRVSRMLIRAFLEDRRPDWIIVEAANGADAVELAGKQPLDLVIMDVNMPGLSGLAAGEQIKLLQPDVRLIILTANVQSSVRQRADALGMAFLHKPINEATVERMLALVEAGDAT